MRIGGCPWYDGDSSRSIDLTDLGGTITGTLRGDPDVKLWTLGLHAGTRLATGASSVATPYVNLDHVRARLRGFTETGLDGANLAVAGGTDSRTYLTAGVRWAAELGALVPELNLGYRYRFGSARSRFTGAFDGHEGSPFSIVSAGDKRATLLAGLSLGGKAGPVDLRIAYDGEYNGKTTSHSASLKIVLPLGKESAAPR